MRLINRIYRNAIFGLLPAIVLSLFLARPKMPLSILVGGLIGLLNVKAIAWGVEGILGTEQANVKMLFFSQFRFFAITVIILLFAYLNLITMPGILIGFSIVLILIIIEGLQQAKRQSSQESK